MLDPLAISGFLKSPLCQSLTGFLSLAICCDLFPKMLGVGMSSLPDLIDRQSQQHTALILVDLL